MVQNNRHGVVRVGLIGLGDLAHSLVQDDHIRVVMNAVDDDDISNALRTSKPELLLVSPGDDWDLAAVRTICLEQHAWSQKVLMLVENPTPHGMIEALRSEVVGYLPVNSPTSQITNAIHKIAEGRTALDRELSNETLKHVATRSLNFPTNDETSPPGKKKLDPNLSAREVEVLEMMARGLTNALIADRLHISRGTVKSHVERIIKKIGSSDRTGAVVKGLELELINFPNKR